MRSPFAIFYGVNLSEGLPILYFLVIGDKSQQNDHFHANVPCCSIGPLAFGRNRRSVIKFGEDRSVSVERCDHSFILRSTNDESESTELTEDGSFVFYDLRHFELPPISERKLSTLLQATKSLLSFLFDGAQSSCPYVLPTAHHRLLVKQLLDQSHLGDNSWKIDFLGLLAQLDHIVHEDLIEQGRAAIENGVTFETPFERGRICFAVLAAILNHSSTRNRSNRLRHSPTPPPLCVPFIPSVVGVESTTPKSNIRITTSDKEDNLLSKHATNRFSAASTLGSPGSSFAPTSAYLTRLDSTSSSSHITPSEEFFLRTPPITHSIILTRSDDHHHQPPSHQTSSSQPEFSPIWTRKASTEDTSSEIDSHCGGFDIALTPRSLTPTIIKSPIYNNSTSLAVSPQSVISSSGKSSYQLNLLFP